MVGRKTKGELKDFQFSEISAYYQSDGNSKLKHGKEKIRDVKLKLFLIQSFTELSHSYRGASKHERPAVKEKREDHLFSPTASWRVNTHRLLNRPLNLSLKLTLKNLKFSIFTIIFH